MFVKIEQKINYDVTYKENKIKQRDTQRKIKLAELKKLQNEGNLQKSCRIHGLLTQMEIIVNRDAYLCCRLCYRKAKKEYLKKPGVREKERKIFIRNKLKNMYGITPEQYDEMLANQNYVCAICFCPETKINPKSKKIGALAVDHCHKTGKVRGLLCRTCNQTLGSFKDDVILLESAITYLKKNY